MLRIYTDLQLFDRIMQVEFDKEREIFRAKSNT